jgi:hypothetical protein
VNIIVLFYALAVVLRKPTDLDSSPNSDPNSSKSDAPRHDPSYSPSACENEDADIDHDSAGDAYLHLPPSPFILKQTTRKHQGPNLVLMAGQSDLYTWSDNRHHCRHHEDLHVPHTAVVDSTCAVLSFFDGMFVCPRLSSIICQQHHCVIPLSDLLAHLEKRHGVVLRLSGLNQAAILSHLRSSLLIKLASTVEDVVSIASGVKLSEPVPGLNAPELCVQCANCSRWFLSRDDGPGRCLYKHWRRDRSECRDWHDQQPGTYLASRLPRVYASKLFDVSSLGGFQVTFHSHFEPPGTTPSSDPPPPPKPVDTTLESPQYLIDLGWTPYVESLGVDPLVLIQLVALPSSRTSGMWPEGSEGYRVEEGLGVLYNFLGQYLRDANTRVNSCNDAVRDALVAG